MPIQQPSDPVSGMTYGALPEPADPVSGLSFAGGGGGGPVYGTGNLRPEYNTAFSWIFWIKTSNTNEVLFSNQVTTGSTRGVFINIKSSGALEVELQGSGGDKMTFVTSATDFANNTEQCVVIAKDATSGAGAGAGGALKVFRNGGAALAGSFSNDALTTTMIDTGPLRLGGSSGGGLLYAGEMAQVGYVRGAALTQTQSASVYNSGDPVDLGLQDFVGSLVSWWKPSLAAGDTTSLVVDRASGTHNATRSGTATGAIAAAVGITGGVAVDSFFFNGSDQYWTLAE